MGGIRREPGNVKTGTGFSARFLLVPCVEAYSRPVARLALPQGEAPRYSATILARGRYDSYRIEAARALGELGGSDAEAALLKALKDKSPWARGAVLRALYAMKATTVGPIIAALRDNELFVRAEAARTMGGLGGPEVVPALLTMLGDEQTRDAAILGLWRLAWRDVEMAPVSG